LGDTLEGWEAEMKRFAIVLILLLGLAGAAAGLFYFRAAGDDSSATSGDSARAAAASENDSGAATVQQADVSDTEDAEESDEEGDAAVPVNVVPVEVGRVSTYITATANLVPEDEVKVLAEAEGRVSALEVEEGDYVRKGQLLAALLRDEALIAHEKAEVREANARQAFERGQRMATQELIAQEDFDKLTLDHRIAQQELAEARWQLSKTEIRAPFDGRITLRNITLGQHVRLTDELFTLTDFTPLIARIYLPEKDVLGLEEGRAVTITLKADESVDFKGSIRQISPVVDTATGTVKVTVAAIEPPKSVRPGGFVTIDIVRETREQTLVLPREAVVRELSRAHVFVAREDVAYKRAVELGLEENGHLEILSGVEAGESVVIAGQGGLKDGSKIKILQADSEDMQAASELGGPRRRVG
jgi:RND family efflux transporter MFP subunit